MQDVVQMKVLNPKLERKPQDKTMGVVGTSMVVR